jgi:hypothetical protein
MANIKHAEFQLLLYRKFEYEHRYDAKTVADQMGISRSSMYAYIDGTTYFPPDLVPLLYRVTDDTDFLDFFLRGTGFTRAPVLTATPSAADLRSQVLDVTATTGELAAQTNGFLADDVLDHKERTILRRTVDFLVLKAESFRAHINR